MSVFPQSAVDVGVTWVLRKDRTRRKCGASFAKGTSVGKFLRHVQGCGVEPEAA